MNETYQDLEPNYKSMTSNIDNLYGWIFTFNIYTKKWKAVQRDHYNELWSGNKGNVLESSSFKTLEELIIRTNGNKAQLNKLVKNDSKH